ncbi:MAG TPA: transglutaminase domain-containing protein [Clostridiaceae bacterium]|nr:transglutaminase domain-containing protein [Clostridiaceae bacterium]
MKINIISLFLWTVFCIPILAGFFGKFTRESIKNSLINILGNIELIVSLMLSIFFTKRIFFNNEGTFYEVIYSKIPEVIRNFLFGNDVLTYLIAVPALFIILTLLMRLVDWLLKRLLLDPLTDLIFSGLKSMKSFPRKLLLGISNLPQSLFIVFLCALLLNFANYYVTIPLLASQMKQSGTYQFVYSKTIYPVLNSNIAKRIPVILNDTFAKLNSYVDEKPPEGISDEKIKIIRYFNGVTLDEAVKSTDEIDNLARQITKQGSTDREQAFLLYQWITENIEYDYDKVEKVSKDPRGIDSGTITAFYEKKGICFDFSSLYVSMCRASGLKVRLVTGLAYSGIAWGDHAWNQVYSREEDNWINVDTTFGIQADYFDKADFNVDHKYAEIQGEW